ncbi:MAG: DNA primase [Deltaproteobacteria bacterium]|nr:DNA primase [Deltaproteobacteria bacterium]MBW2047307.1 DNA primase [Deltaproteobacteria bacterium]MBW2110023.1 DNA primase [Deltaproteobacteria bacterium]MBW2353334.1 DNA primase [Deltaproteobacteria bacterium]
MQSHRSVKEEIKQVADIVQAIGQFVQLKKAGRNFTGLCPFHAEKDPSFNVSPDRQMFHCFGCKKGGDIFAFWMEYHGLTFPEALKDLADRYNVQIPDRFSPSEEKKRSRLRETLLKINESAAQYFQRALTKGGRGNPAADYLKKRGITGDIISEFRLGWAPDSWDGITGYLRRQDTDMERAAKAGLIVNRKGGGYYDRFRGRIMFPIINLRGQVVGFGGRVLDDSLPKYLNTPETPVFHKGEFPYGLNASFRAIREKGTAVIVEGYMDLLALRRHGLDQVVATLGTALTPQHIRRIKGYAREALVVFDSDEAGIEAALRSLPLFLNEGLPARAVVLPEGHDPDSFVNREGLPRFMELLNRASPMFDFFLEQKLSRSGTDIEEKVRVLKEILPALSQLHNEAQRTLYAGRVSERIGIKEEVVLSELNSFRRNRSENTLERNLKGRVGRTETDKKIGDIQLLNLLVHHPGTVEALRDSGCGALISNRTVSKAVAYIFHKQEENGPVSLEGLVGDVEDEDVRIQLREVMLAESIYPEQEVDQAVMEIMEKARQKRLSDSVKEIRDDPEALNDLLLKLRDRNRC